MSVSKEYEDRVMLSEEQYFDIVTDLIRDNHHHVFLNIRNIYFDSNTLFLKENHMVLRVRTTNSMNVELTLKVKGEDCDEEYTDKLNIHQHNELIENLKFPMGDVICELRKRSIDISSLNMIADIATKRLEIEKNDYLIVVDRNRYSNIEDFNLEIESSSRNKANEVIKEFCNKYKIEYSDKYKSKSRRAIEEALKNRGN